jgi:4-hydroxy-tetrahydrodipicolinate synthase
MASYCDISDRGGASCCRSTVSTNSAIYRWFSPLLDLDISTFMAQNIRLTRVYAIQSNDRVRAPRLPGETRGKVVAVIEKALASRPELPKF